MLKIRLSRRGKKHAPTYRIVVKEARSKRDGDYIDDLGWYNPQVKPSLQIDMKKLKMWQERGAQISDGLSKLLDKKSKQ